MIDVHQLLRVAIEDNVAWCSAVCSAHGSKEVRSPEAWANLSTSPPFYPNIITRQKGIQKQVEELVRQVGKINPSGKWGIKDSFGDLTLAEQGFERLLVGAWYGGTVSNDAAVGWKTVGSQNDLRLWENAWGSREDIIFPDSLLEDDRIVFWFKGKANAIEAGFVSFNTGFSVGLSNWFSLKDDSFAQMGLLQAAQSVSKGLPTVCWSTDDLTLEHTSLSKLGPLQVWISK